MQVLLEFEFIPHYIRDTDDPNSDLPREEPLPSYSTGNLTNESHTPFSADLRDSLMVSTLSNIEEDFNSAELSIANGNHPSQELHSLQHLDDDPTTTPSSLHMGVGGGASQDIEMVNQTWHSQNSGSQDPNSPHLTGKTADFDTGYATTQDSQEFHHTGPGGTEVLFTSSADNHGTSGGHEQVDFPSHSSIHTPHSRVGGDFSSSGNKSGGSIGGHTSSSDAPHFLNMRREEGGHHQPHPHQPRGRYGSHDDSSGSGKFHHSLESSYSPSPHPSHPIATGGMEYSPLGRSFDGSFYGGYHHMPSLDEGGGTYDQSYYDHFKRRPMSMYGTGGMGVGPGEHGRGYHHTGPPFGTPPGRYMMASHYGGRPGYPMDMYDPRTGPLPPGTGRFGRQDPPLGTFPPRSYSHERVDGTPPSSITGMGMRTRPYPMMGRGMEEEFPGAHMEMFLSQPTTYPGYEQPPAGFGMPMMGR